MTSVGVAALRGAPRGRRRTGRLGLYVGASAAALALLVALLIDLLSPGAATPAPTPIAVTPSQSSVREGPGGRIALTSWALSPDPGDTGLAQGWSGGGFPGRLVSVPYVPNAAPITGAAGLRNYHGSIAWYRTAFTVARPGSYALHFESVNYRATVWMDGHELGSHVGPYLPFEFRVQAAAGNHTVVVRVDWRNPAAQARAGFHRTWFNFGGIDREVSIRPAGASELQAPNLRTRLVPGPDGRLEAQVNVSVEVRNNGPDRTVVPAGTLHLEHGTQTIPLDFSGLRLAHGATGVLRARATADTPALWAPGSPNLYDLALAVGNEASYFAPVGLREFTWSKGRLYLNRHRVVLHGASIQEDARGHGDALTPADQDVLVNELRAVDANAVRAQHPLDPGLLERLDRAGILVWQGVGPVDPAGDWTATTPALLAQAERRVHISVRQDAVHPSIVAWNLANEIGGNGHAGGQAEYVRASAAWIHAHDRGRLVAVDVWGEHPPAVAGPLYRGVDAIGETNYTGWYNGAQEPSAEVASTIRDRLAAMRHTFAGKVLVISEFGAEANELNSNLQPGSYSFQTRLLSQHIGIYKSDPALSGMLIWALRDFAVTPSFAGGSITRTVPAIRLVKGLNQKGLFNYDLQGKAAVGTVARAYAGMPR